MESSESNESKLAHAEERYDDESYHGPEAGLDGIGGCFWACILTLLIIGLGAMVAKYAGL